MKRKTLPAITGPVSVSFKHENEVDGTAVGPVVVIDRASYDTWIKTHGTPLKNGRYMYPFGTKPEGRHDLGWMTKQKAREVAAHYVVALEES